MTVVEARSLGVRTHDGTSLLADVDLDVARGEVVLVAGPPGGGKTLVLKAVAGLLDGRDDLTVTGTVRRPDGVGMVFQDPAKQLVRRTVRRDVAFGLENEGLSREAMRERIARYAAALDVEALLDRDVRSLSHGETATVALLGVLVTEPDVVLLDEPLASLDHRNARLVLDAVDRIVAAGATVIVTEHDLRDLLCRTDQVVLLRDGRVAERGPPDALAGSLRDVGLGVPFATEVALELRERRDDRSVPVPLSSEG